MLKIFSLVFILFLNSCVTPPEARIEGNSEIDKLDIRGFKQFPVYTSRNLLGYIEASGQEKTFDKMIWKGKSKEDAIKQSLVLNYSIEDAKTLNAGFKEIFSGEVGFENIKSMSLILENPVQYILEDLRINSEFKDKKDFFEKKYIGAVLKVDKIRIEFQNKQGLNLKTEADLKINSVKLGASIKTKQDENSIFFAENAFVGYKLFDAPENLDSYFEKEDKKLKIVIFPFDIEGAKPREDRLKIALQEAASRALNRVDNFFVLDRNSYQKLLEDDKQNDFLKIGKSMSANRIVLGKFTREGLDARIISKLIDVETNSVVPDSEIKIDLNLRGKTTPSIADELEDKILEHYGITYTKTKISVLGTNQAEAFDFFRRGKEKFILLDEESLEEALPDFKKATELDPNYSDAFSYLSETYLRLYEFKLFRGDKIGSEKMKIYGLENSLKAIEISPNSSLANRVISFYYYYLDPDYEKSKIYAKRATELDPKDAEAKMRYFIVLAKENSKLLSSENKELKEIFEMNPNLISTNFYLSKCFRKEKNYSKAHERLEKILEISPKNISIYSEISDIYFEEGKFKESLEELNKIDEIYPNHFQVQIYYANYFLKKSDYKKSLEYINIAKKLQPKSTIPLELHANILVKEKNYDSAIQNYLKCIELDSKKGKFYNSLGILLKLKNEFNSSVQYFKKGQLVDTKHIPLYENLGQIYFDGEKFDEANIQYQKLVELEPSSFNYRLLADSDIALKKFDKGIFHYGKALELDTEEFMIYNEIGFAYIGKKDYTKASENFVKAKEKGNNEVKSYSFKGYGDISKKEKNIDKAIESYKKSIELFENNFDSKMELANLLHKKNNSNEAILILKNILEKQSLPKANYFLGKILKDLGRIDESKSSFKKACELNYLKACNAVK